MKQIKEQSLQSCAWMQDSEKAVLLSSLAVQPEGQTQSLFHAKNPSHACIFIIFCKKGEICM